MKTEAEREAEEVWRVVREHNRRTVAPDVEGVAELLEDELVVVPPGFAQRVDRAAYLASIEGFHAQGKIHEYQEEEPDVDVFGAAAVVTFRYASRWSIGDEEVGETGRDLFFLVRRDEGWRIAWRTLMPDPRKGAAADGASAE